MTSISVLTLVGALTLLVVGAIASPHPYQLGTVAGPGTSCSRLLPIILTNVPLDVVQREAAPALGKPILLLTQYFLSTVTRSTPLSLLQSIPALLCFLVSYCKTRVHLPLQKETNRHHLVVSPPPAPTNAGASRDCTQWYTVTAADNMACKNAMKDGVLSLKEFLTLNPFVNSGCTNLWVGYAYCIAGKLSRFDSASISR